MTDTEKEIERLDKEFECYQCKYQNLMCCYGNREEYLATNWLTKLKNSNSNVEERRLRNRFIKFFLKKFELCEHVFQEAPFKTLPAEFFGELIDMQKYLPRDPNEPWIYTEDEKLAHVADLFTALQDKGAFLSQLPVPRDGSFIIVVLTPNENENSSIIACPDSRIN